MGLADLVGVGIYYLGLSYCLCFEDGYVDFFHWLLSKVRFYGT